jgi:hypothetical protein
VRKSSKILMIAAIVIPTLAFSGTPPKPRPPLPQSATEIVLQFPAPKAQTFDLSPLQMQARIRRIHEAAQEANLEKVFREVQRQDYAKKAAGYAQAVASSARVSHSHVTTYHPATTPVATIGGSIPYNYALWMRVHNCEQPETWHAGGHFGNGLPSGGTGLGFSEDAVRIAVRYAAQRGVILPASGWEMSVDQQMQMAQAMLDATGGGPDCL